MLASAPHLPVSTPLSPITAQNSPACLDGKRIPRTPISDLSYDLPNRKKHLPIFKRHTVGKTGVDGRQL